MNAQTDTSGEITSPDLMDVLRSRKEQARRLEAAYSPPRVAEDTMLYWLSRAAKELRLAAGRKQVHVAAAISKDQATIYRFEDGRHWPRETDLFIAGYAEDLDITPLDIWGKALEMWREADKQASVEDLAARRQERSAPGAFADAVASAATRGQSPGRRAEKPTAKRSRQAGR